MLAMKFRNLAALSAIAGLATIMMSASRDGPGPSSAAPPAAFGALQPRVSPDGRTIACIYQNALCTIPAEGGTLKRLGGDPNTDSHPAWSPDGKRIAFASGGTLRLIESATGGEVKLPKRIGGRGPFWFSPDGTKVLGRFAVAPNQSPIAWLDLATGEVRPVAGIAESYAVRLRGAITLSADGRWIVFAEHQDREGEQGGNNGPEADLWRIPAGGGTPEKVARWPARIYGLCPDPLGDAVYAVTDGGMAHDDVWHLPLADTLAKARKITWGQADEDSPSLPARGGALFHTDNRQGCTALVRQDLDTGEADLVGAASIDFGSPTTEVRISITDQDGAPSTARVSVKDRSGGFHAPPGSMHHRILNREWFYVTGRATLVLPEGEYEIRAMRGPEHRVTHKEMSIRGQSADVPLALERWTDMAKRGWFSGENHIHANYGYGEWYNTPASILELCKGEDLNVANLVLANSDGNGVFDREFFRGRLDPVSEPHTLLWWNQEFRSTIWGHMTLFHLRQVVEPVYTGFPNTTNPWDVPTNGDVARRTHWQRGTASYTHPTNNPLDFYDQPYSAKGLPVDAALGLIDVMDVMGYVYEPSMPFWHRLLNCGFRIPAAAGTDVFLNRVNCYPPGHGRVYVHLDGPLTYEAWIDGMKKGRSFVTNSPMLEFTANGEEPGGTLRLDQPGKIVLKGGVWSQHPVDKLELVQNGKVIATGNIEAGGLAGTLAQEVQVEHAGWLALRASGPACEGSMLRPMGAHTNPVYVEVRDKPFDASHDAEFFLEWIDRLEADLKTRDRIPPGEMSDVMTHLNQAREVYRKLAGIPTRPAD